VTQAGRLRALTAILAALLLAACSSPQSVAPLADTPDEHDAETDAERTGGVTEGGMRLLRYAPPELVDPITIRVDAASGPSNLSMDPQRDYVIEMPDEPVRRGLALVGGRNVVMIGGEIFIPHQGPNPTINARRALHVSGATGVVHIEGVLMHGDDISEGIQTSAPDAIVQIQNVGIFNVHARDQKGFTDNHPDIIQTWGSVGALRVDGLTGETDYQGLFFKADYNGPHGPVELHNVNVRGLPTARYLVWTSNQGGGYPDVTLENVWVEASPARAGGFAMSVWPDANGAHPYRLQVGTNGDGVETGSWPAAVGVTGEVSAGRPPGGDFVRAEAIGVGYRSPGYE
jgi:hypothetical protein